MHLTLASLLALFSLAITASAAGCDCFDYTAADAGEKCDGGYNSNKMDIDEHCKGSGIKTAAVCCGSCIERDSNERSDGLRIEDNDADDLRRRLRLLNALRATLEQAYNGSNRRKMARTGVEWHEQA